MRVNAGDGTASYSAAKESGKRVVRATGTRYRRAHGEGTGKDIMNAQLRMLAGFIALSTLGCSVHAHSEWHTGSGSAASSGAERPARQSEAHEPRKAPSGRDHVVRVHVSSSPGSHDTTKRSSAPPTHVVHPTASSSRAPEHADEGGAQQAHAGQDAASDAADRRAAAQPDGDAEAHADSTTRPGDETTSEGEHAAPGKTSTQHETEPHEARPSKQRRVVKGQTREPASTAKGERRE
jgi:hypothetical protein